MKKSNPIAIILRVVICTVAIFVLFWFELPAINIQSKEFWSFIVISLIICLVVNAFSTIIAFFKKVKIDQTKGFAIEGGNPLKGMGKPVKVSLIAIAGIIVIAIGAGIVGSELFNAKGYNQLLALTDGSFNEDVAELQMSQIPVVDRNTASRLGQRKLGEMSDLVSQFSIEENYTQINYKNKPVRVTPLSYGDPIKWLGNQAQGIPAFIMVDMVTQETTLARLPDGMKYSNGEYFMRNLNRHLRFNYPTKMFDNISFEVDDNDVPYWVASTVDYKIGLWSGKDIGGAVLVNAITGECQYYDLESIPRWVDQVYDSEMIIEQLIYNGKYRSGFFNSIFGQKGVLKPTDGYNYIAINDDVYLYTGMTSAMSDQSNVGFVLVNLRTKESKFYPVPGAEEYSAMSSAEGQVQNLKYKATFPLLLNVSDRPTYFMSLKDDAGLVKMYAYVDVENYQVVGTGGSIDEARVNYISKLKIEDIAVVPSNEEDKQGVVEQISSAVVNGNTNYFIKLTNDENVYTVPITMSKSLPFAKVGDAVTMKIEKEKKNVTAFTLGTPKA